MQISSLLSFVSKIQSVADYPPPDPTAHSQWDFSSFRTNFRWDLRWVSLSDQSQAGAPPWDFICFHKYLGQEYFTLLFWQIIYLLSQNRSFLKAPAMFCFYFLKVLAQSSLLGKCLLMNKDMKESIKTPASIFSHQYHSSHSAFVSQKGEGQNQH